MVFQKITICLDMYGCPNRCRHCWLGHSPNGSMPASELEHAAEQFRPYTEKLWVYNWYREPDYRDDYKEMWELCRRLSGGNALEHFELASFWRLVRDREYARWLSSLGLKSVQLTLFGGEETTDYYVGRKGAYQEIVKAIEILLENRISPRIQTFVNQSNMDELPQIERLMEDLELEKRCREFGGKFSFFLHQGCCEGANEQFYHVMVTPEDLPRIPQRLVDYTLEHFDRESIVDVFGRTEQALYEELAADVSTASYVSETPVLYIDRNFDVYPNISAPAPYWRLGNLKKDGAGVILRNYSESKSTAQDIRLRVPLCDMVKSQGDPESRRMFGRGDYICFLLNRYCRCQCVMTNCGNY